MTTTKIFWITDMETQETYEPNFSKLVAQMSASGDHTPEQVEKMLNNLEEDEAIIFTYGESKYEIEVEILEETEEEDSEDD